MVKEGEVLLVSYEDLIADPNNQVKRIIEYLGIEKSETAINASILLSPSTKTRKNIGISGRGEQLNPEQKQRIRNYAGCYPNINFKCKGI